MEARTGVASALLLGAGATTAALAVHGHVIAWPEIAWGLVLMSTGALVHRRTAASQVFVRGAAWAVILPIALVTALAHQLPYFMGVVPAIACGLALVLARPVLRSDEVRASFDPVAFGSWLLAATTGAAAFGFALARLAIVFAQFRIHDLAIALFALAATLVATAIGTVRMRAWGMLAGIASAVLAMFVAMLGWRGALGEAMLFSAIPGVMMLGAIIAGRLGLGGERDRVRIGTSDTTVRIASEPSDAEIVGELGQVDAIDQRKIDRIAIDC